MNKSKIAQKMKNEQQVSCQRRQIVYKEMMLYNLTRLNSSFWKVERSNAKNECY